MDKIDKLILVNLMQNCDVDVLRDNLAVDGVVDLTLEMLQTRLDEMLQLLQDGHYLPRRHD